MGGGGSAKTSFGFDLPTWSAPDLGGMGNTNLFGTSLNDLLKNVWRDPTNAAVNVGTLGFLGKGDAGIGTAYGATSHGIGDIAGSTQRGILDFGASIDGTKARAENQAAQDQANATAQATYNAQQLRNYQTDMQASLAAAGARSTAMIRANPALYSALTAGNRLGADQTTVLGV